MSDIGPGSVVVCVAKFPNNNIAPLQKNWRYRVRGVLEGNYKSGKFGVGLYLHGIQNPISPCGVEWAYCITGFRPIDERDAEIFRQMIADTKHFKVRAHHD